MGLELDPEISTAVALKQKITELSTAASPQRKDLNESLLCRAPRFESA